MARNNLPKPLIASLSSLEDSCFSDEKLWLSCLTELEITNGRHIRIASEGALLGGLEVLGFNQDLLILSDGAGQFNILKHALCWVHAERHINKLIGFTDLQREARENALTDIWNLYQSLKAYKLAPTTPLRKEIETTFDELFTRETAFASLNVAMRRIHKDRSEMLLVLDYPFLPLHNNLSENDIREYVKRRKVSGSTRSDKGRECRDTFTSLKKTCRKLSISFWKYLNDRITKKYEIPSFPELVTAKLTEEVLA